MSATVAAPSAPLLSTKPSFNGALHFLTFNEKKQIILSKLRNDNSNIMLDDLILVELIAELDCLDFFIDDTVVENKCTKVESNVNYINNLSKPRFNRRKHRLIKPSSIDDCVNNYDSSSSKLAKRQDYIAKHNNNIREQRLRQIIERLVSDKKELMQRYQQTQLNQALFFKEKNTMVKSNLVNQFVKVVINAGMQKVIEFELLQVKKREELFKIKLSKGSYIWSVWKKFKMKRYVKNILAHARRIGYKKLKQDQQEENEWRLRVARRLITENSHKNVPKYDSRAVIDHKVPDYYEHFCYISQIHDLRNHTTTIPSLPPVYKYQFHSDVNEDDLWKRASINKHKSKILERRSRLTL